ncbi:MAG: phytanoyl-CoA dioxygenase family protein [Nitrososphaera sp.]|nr:phytanoyl-CoA dioxygenase family protein [Nitrososphaera sp.]MCI0590275.1 phytanoyl-CoA dioxygenase family protein [Gammaproteobacteria bacterium]
MTTRLSRQQLNQYDRDGIVFPVKVFSADEVSLFRGALESIADNCGEGSLKRFDSLHLFFDWAHRLVTHDTLLNAIEDILGDDLVIYGTLVFFKPPQDSSYVTWHQDSVYSGLHLTPSTSAWIALTASHRANGCMRVIPGSHKQGLLDHASVRDDSNLLRRGERVKMVVDESQALDVVLQPGEMSLHHSTIVHGSNPNTSSEPRIGFIVRFVTNQITNRDRPMLRVRGEADCSHLSFAQPPLAMDQRSAFAAWRGFSNGKSDG